MNSTQIPILHSSSSIERLNQAVERAKLLPECDESRQTGDAVANLSAALLARYDRTQSLDDLNSATTAGIEAARLTSPGNPSRSIYLRNLSRTLWKCFTQTAMREYLDKSIEVIELAVLLAPSGRNTVKANALHDLSESLLFLFKSTARMEDLERAITTGSQAIESCDNLPHSGCDRSMCISNLARLLVTRFELNGSSLDDLNRAITLSFDAINTASHDSFCRAKCLHALVNALLFRSQSTGRIEDLNDAIVAAREAIECAAQSQNLLNQPCYYGTLGHVLLQRYQSEGLEEDLNDAISAMEEALAATSKNHPNRPIILQNLCSALQLQYQRLGLVALLDRSIDYTKEALTQTPAGHSNRPALLHNYGVYLAERFTATGAITDMDGAILALEEALNCVPHGSAIKGQIEGTLGDVLLNRYDRIGSGDDLYRAVKALRSGVISLPKKHLSRPTRVNSLARGLRLLDRLELFGDALDESVEIIDEVLSSIQSTHPMYSCLLSNRSASLVQRFDGRPLKMDDLINAAADIEKAIELSEPQSASLADRIYDRGRIAITRFQQTQSITDLNMAIRDFTHSLESSRARDHGDFLVRLGQALMMKFELTRSDTDKIRAVAAYEEAVFETMSTPMTRIKAATKSIELLELSDPQRLGRIVRTAVELLPTVNFRALHYVDQIAHVSSCAKLVKKAVAISLRSGANEFETLQLLGLGLGVTGGFQLDLRTDLERLERAHSEYAAQFSRLRNELNRNPIDDWADTPMSHGSISQISRCAIAKNFDCLVTKIRLLPGFERFLLSPSEGDLLALAQRGPIVIFNVDTARSDAFLVEKDKINYLHLPRLLSSDVERNAKFVSRTLTNPGVSTYMSLNRDLSLILEWLWDVAVGPILNALGFNSIPADDNKWPHVWWVASGWLNLLPIHAAGRYGDKKGENALDRVVSSYTPSLKGLAFAREKGKKVGPRPPEALLVSMPATEELPNLPGTLDEATEISYVLPQSMPRRFLLMPTTAEVESQLSKHQIVHLACHGMMMSRGPNMLVFKDNFLDVLSIIGLELEYPKLIYLSACNTAGIRNAQMLDEAFHVGGAFQMIGFPHVIATLWAVDDRTSVDVAKDIYGYMHMDSNDLKTIDVAAAAKAVHAAVRRLRDKELEVPRFQRRRTLYKEPFLWACYIHLGA